MPVALGTRTLSNPTWSDPPGASETRTHSEDPGMALYAAPASTVFSASLGTAVPGSGSLPAGMVAGTTVLIEGTNLNNGTFLVTAYSASLGITLDPPPKSETSTTCIIRTP